MICLVLVACAAASASAQDAQDDDPVAKTIREAQAAKDRQVERALLAPTKAFEPIERKTPAPPPPPPPPPATWTGQSSIPLLPVAIGVGAIIVLFVAQAVWRWAGAEPPSR
jgi:hypothetical protein